MHCLTHWSWRCWKCKNEKVQLIGTKCSSCYNQENACPHLMFLFTNKKVIGVWTFEVSCIKWMEKSEVVKKVISMTSEISDWYHFVKIPILFALISILIMKKEFFPKIYKRYLLFWGNYQNYFIQCVENIRIFMRAQHEWNISMFQNHEMWYIWYLLTNRLSFYFILFRRLTVNQLTML